ncbi:GFA domain-containing protein [Mycena kentingensis (nom. inval.)]|nr:GFA domain-containing protein [Mycena kentingensis (nom. inval.)]
MSDPTLVEYKGNCHCGAFKFALKAPNLASLEAIECDCSICLKNGYLRVKPVERSFVIEKGDEGSTLVSYRFGKKDIVHKFCPTCGTSVLARSSADPQLQDFWINFRAVKDVDFWSLPRGAPHQGSELGEAYQIPSAVQAPGPIPDGSTAYHGSCHCGSIAFTVVHRGNITSACSCNCSSCGRSGAAWIYPLLADVAFRGVPEYATEYTFAQMDTFHGFCKVCGVEIYERFIGFTNEGEDRSLTRALNLRVMHGIDLNAVDMEKEDGKAYPPTYVVPA